MTPFLRVFSYSLLVLALLALFNFIVDPYGIFNSVHVKGVNYPKSVAQNHEKMVKAYLVSEIRPRAVALGTSRVGFGIDPGSSRWDGPGPRFNLSLADGDVYVTRRFLEHAIAINPPKQVVIGLDFFAFNAKRKTAHDYSENLLAVNGVGKNNADYKSNIILSSVMTYSTLKNALKALKTSRQDRIQVINSETGMRQFAMHGDIYQNDELFELPEMDYLDNAYTAFQGHAGFYIGEKYLIGDKKEYSFEDALSGNSALDEFLKIVQLSKANDIALYAFISPTHAWHMEEIRSIGLWPLFEQWKRELVNIMEQEYEGSRYHLYDFSGYNSITSLDVPEGRMREYKDSSHYLPVVGDLVLSRLFGRNSEGVPEEFGRRLTGGNLESVLGLIRKEQSGYHRSHSDDVREIERIAAKFDMSADTVIIEGGARPFAAKYAPQR